MHIFPLFHHQKKRQILSIIKQSWYIIGKKSNYFLLFNIIFYLKFWFALLFIQYQSFLYLQVYLSSWLIFDLCLHGCYHLFFFYRIVVPIPRLAIFSQWLTFKYLNIHSPFSFFLMPTYLLVAKLLYKSKCPSVCMYVFMSICQV